MTWATVLALGTGVPSLLSRSTDVEFVDGGSAGPVCLPLQDVDEAPDGDAVFLQRLYDPLADSGADRLEFEGCDLTVDGTSPESWARELWQGLPPAVAVMNGHTEKSGRWIDYEQISRRPERPDSYLAYRYPVIEPKVVSGYDLSEPDGEQRRGTMNAVGHGGIDLAVRLGTPITLPRLEHQMGDAEILYVGWLFGETIVTRHTVLEGGARHDYLLLFGHLAGVREDVHRGLRVRDGTLLGFVGNSGSPEFVHLHLETRRVRDGVSLRTLSGDALRAREFSIVSDPRNVLALRPAPAPVACQLRPVTRKPQYWLGDSLTLGIEGDSSGAPFPR